MVHIFSSFKRNDQQIYVIPDAELLIIKGMGHDLPRGAWPLIIKDADTDTGYATRNLETEKIPPGPPLKKGGIFESPPFLKGDLGGFRGILHSKAIGIIEFLNFWQYFHLFFPQT